MRLVAATMGAVFMLTGCATLVGLDFDAYREGISSVDGGEAPQCVPRSTVRCLCELSEGIQTCSSSGRLSTCECRDASAPPAGPSCGNGEVEEGEGCDDKNTISGDGCSSLCVPDGRPAAVESCPGQPVTVWRGRTVRMALETFERGTGDTSGTCGLLAQPERVYAIAPVMAGELAITVSSDSSVSFSIRTTCTSPTSVSCDAVSAGTTVSRKIPVHLGETYFLVLEPNEAAARATYSITLDAS